MLNQYDMNTEPIGTIKAISKLGPHMNIRPARLASVLGWYLGVRISWPEPTVK